MTPRHIPNTTLVIVDCAYYGNAVAALKKCLEKCSFDRVLFLTDIPIQNLDGIEVVLIPKITSKDEYSRFIVKELYNYLTTDFLILTQWDAEILYPECFNEELFNYDYAGALWLETDGLRNGNGGFSFRSKRLQKVLSEDPIIEITNPEDVSICRIYRRYLEGQYSFKWATDELCEQFSYELNAPFQKTFGKHGFFHDGYKPTIVIKREASLGDVVAVEPILEYYHNKGYRVVLDTLPQFFQIFRSHRFKVNHPGETDPRVLKTAQVVNLDYSYESVPQKNHIKAYFDFCGVKDYKLKNATINLAFDPKDKYFKLFKKYVVIHIDKRPSEQGRNVYGLNWHRILQVLKHEGYQAIQIGLNEHEQTGGVEMNTPEIPFLMYLLGGADLFIGSDSGPANLAVGLGIPSILFFGSVDPEIIYPDLSNIKVIQHKKVCDTPKCWHSKPGVSGSECIVNTSRPPCCDFDTDITIKKIQEVINPV